MTDLSLIPTSDLRDAMDDARIDIPTRLAYQRELRARGWTVDIGGTRLCPGLPSHPYDGPCGNEAAAGDRYCPGCRAEFDALAYDLSTSPDTARAW